MALRARSSNMVAQAFVVREVVTRVYARAHLIGWVATNVRRSPGILSRYLPDLAGTFPMRIGCPFCGMPQQRNGSAFPLHPNSHIVEEKGRRQPGTQSG